MINIAPGIKHQIVNGAVVVAGAKCYAIDNGVLIAVSDTWQGIIAATREHSSCTIFGFPPSIAQFRISLNRRDNCPACYGQGKIDGSPCWNCTEEGE